MIIKTILFDGLTDYLDVLATLRHRALGGAWTRDLEAPSHRGGD